MKRFLQYAALGAMGAIIPAAACAGWNAVELNRHLELIAPERGIQELEVTTSDSGRSHAVVAHYEDGGLPARDGIVIGIEAPPAVRGYASYVEGGLLGRHWTAPAWFASLEDVPRAAQFVIWREPGGEWCAVIPLAGGGMSSRIKGIPGGLAASASSFMEGYKPRAAPVFAIGFGENPYDLVRELYAFGFETMHETDPKGVIGLPRWEKDYPEIFKYVGWCSWNAHYRTVNHEDLIKQAASFKEAGFPLRWMLIDDGWQSVTNEKKNWFPWSQGKLYMTSFEANKKFPGGLKRTTEILKQDYGIEYVGVWHTFQGYWNGIAIDSELGREYEDALMPVSETAAIPDPRSDAGERFWMDWYEFLSDSGVDFTKVDNQSTLASLVGGELPVSKAMAQAQQNIQRASQRHFDSNMINCMEMNIDVVYQWRTTNIGRSSGDYVPILPHNPRTHQVKNVMNAMWIENTLYPDYDMWKTHDQHPEYHGVARAMSGGPVYITDNAGRERFEHLWPLVLSDGRIIMADRPGLPVERTMLYDPLRERVPLMAFVRSGRAGAVALWNVDRFERRIKADVSPSDVNGIEGEEFALYEHFTGELNVAGRDDSIETRLSRWGVRLYMVVPVEEGFAAIGLSDKYLSIGTVLGVKRNRGATTVSLAEPGRFVAYCNRMPSSVSVGGTSVPAGRVSLEGGLLQVELDGLDLESGPLDLAIRW